MRNRRSVVCVLALGLVLALAGGSSVAQDSAPQAALGTAFTYQGSLEDAGGPVDGRCDLRFKLFNAATGGTQIGGTRTLTGVEVSDGLFTVQLDFGAGAFNGYARWLDIAVRCPAGTGSYAPLSPRQPLSPTPYARYAATAPWSGLTGLSCAAGQVVKWSGSAWVCGDDDGGPGAHDHWGEYWPGSGTGLELISSDSIALFAEHSSTSGTTPAVLGTTHSESADAAGVVGQVSTTSAGNYSAGVAGRNAGTAQLATGVSGVASGMGTGVLGTSPHGVGVRGTALDGSSQNIGVAGESLSENGTGVLGKHNRSTGITPGVQGTTSSKSAQASGVLGVVTQTTVGSFSAGVRGINAGTGSLGIGVYGEHKGSGWGVYGTSDSGLAGYFSGDIQVSGSCVGCVLAYVGVNDGGGTMEPGDLVAVSGVDQPLAGASVPLVRVQRAGARNAGALFGVVQSRGSMAGTQGDPGQEIASVVRTDGAAEPGDYVFVAVQGLVQVKASAEGGAIDAGDTVAPAGSPAGFAGRMLDSGKDQRIGRAMESLDGATGLIWVLVDLQ